METYKIKAGATLLYIKEDEGSTKTARFIADNEGKKIFVHGVNENNENNVIVSKYENWEKHEIPIDLIEKFEEIESETIEDKQIKKESVPEENKLVLLLEKNKMIIAGIIIGIFLSIFAYNLNVKNLKASVIEQNPGTIIQTGSGFLDTLNQRNAKLDNKENFEIEKQKRIREEKRKAIEQFDSEINASIESVKTIRKEKEEIAKQKLDFAQ